LRDTFCLRVYVTVFVFAPTRFLRLHDKFIRQTCFVFDKLNYLSIYRLSSIVYRLGLAHAGRNMKCSVRNKTCNGPYKGIFKKDSLCKILNVNSDINSDINSTIFFNKLLNLWIYLCYWECYICIYLLL